LPPHPYFSRPFAKRGSDEELASGVLMGGVWPDAAFECPVRFPERFRTVKVETHFCSKRPMWDRGPMESSVGRPRHGQPAALVSGRRLATGAQARRTAPSCRAIGAALCRCPAFSVPRGLGRQGASVEFIPDKT